MATREQVAEVLRRKGYQGALPGETQPQQAQNDLPTILAQLKASGLIPQPKNGLQKFGDVLSVAGGGKPIAQEESGLGDIGKLVAGEAVKQKFNQSPYNDLIEKSKAIEAARNTGNRTLFDQLTGTPNQPQQAIPQQEESQLEAPEIDPFTGKLSSRGVNQEYKNQMEKYRGIQEIKAHTPTAKQKDDLANIENVETLLMNLENDAKSVPSGWKGVQSQVGGFFSRGKTDTNTVVYNDQRKAVAVALYRALTGDTRLSDADAASRALPLLWKPDEADEVKVLKFEKLRKLLQDRKKIVSEHIGGEEGDSQVGQIVTGGDGRQYRIVGGDPNDPDVEPV